MAAGSYQHQLSGELSIATVAAAEKQLHKLDNLSELTVDFAQVTRVDSSALVFIFASHRLAKEKMAITIY